MPESPTANPNPSSGAAPKKRRRWILYLVLVGMVLMALPALYTAVALNWSYSSGDRAGVLQKFSKKGWLCKTYEGELAVSIMRGMQPEIFYFTVRDEKVVPQIQAAVGKQVMIHYHEHRGVPSSCFGDTMYYVDGVKIAQ